MREEISAAVVFISRIARKGGKDCLTEEKIQEFSDKLEGLLSERFKDHWYQDAPQKGQGYRCIRMNETVARDPVIVQAAEDCGIEYTDLRMPPELTIWVDPKEVCCRFGEAKGSWCTLFKEGMKDQRVNTPVIDRVLTESAHSQHSKPIEVTRINARHSPHSSSSPPTHQRGYHPINNLTLRNYNHNHNNNLTKFNNNKHFNQNRFRVPPPPMMVHGGQSVSPTFPKNKFGSSPPPHPPPPMPKSSSFQMHPPLSTGRNDRYHWVRGADLVKA